MERAFDTVVDRTRTRLDVPKLRTLFGVGQRPRPSGGDLSPRQAVVIERPRWNLTLFKVHFGLLTLKGYTKGERVLRFEAIVHNTRELGCGRVIAKLPIIVARLKAILDRALRTLQWMDRAFVADETLDQLPLPSQLGKTRVGGIDLGRPRMRTVLTAIMALALTPRGFTAGELTAKVQEIGGHAFRD